MATRKFEELKPEIIKALQRLKAHEDFATDKVQEALKVLRNASYRSRCSNRREVVMFLIGEGFGQLLMEFHKRVLGQRKMETKWLYKSNSYDELLPQLY